MTNMKPSYLFILTLFLLSSCVSKHPIPPKTSPYHIDGQWYYPTTKTKGFRQNGLASWYGKAFHGKPTASGEVFNMHSISAAHKTLPLGTYVKVSNLKNGKTLVVRINDRGPFVAGRIIDLSYKAAKKLDMIEDGVVPVEVSTYKPLISW
ncbi:MAG: septal ring lytic transglycosylase RlpA family protein [Chlamydiota bacterium]